MTKREQKAIARAIGINAAHKERRIVAAAQCAEMMEFIKNLDCKGGSCVPLIEAFNAGVAEEIGQQTAQEL